MANLLPRVAFLTVQNLRLKASKKLPIALVGTGLAAHLRYRRETLGLTRSDAAKQIGVRGAAVGQWETGEHHPENEYWPAIIRFIGYDPICSDPQTVPEKIAFLCRHMGLSGVGLAALLGVDKATIYKWEHGAPPRTGWAKAARLDALVLSVMIGEPSTPEAPARTGLAAALFRTRRERHLTQDQVARSLGVNPATYKIWEGGNGEPQVNNWPLILGFLGWDPICSNPKTVSEKIRAVRRRRGFTYQALGKLLGASEHVVLRLENHRTTPSQHALSVLDMLLETVSLCAPKRGTLVPP